MSSRKTWERRVLAPLIKELEDRGALVIEGLVDTGHGLVFAHEALSEHDEGRARDAVDLVLARLLRSYGTVGAVGVSDREDDEEGFEADEEDEALDEELLQDDGDDEDYDEELIDSIDALVTPDEIPGAVLDVSGLPAGAVG